MSARVLFYVQYLLGIGHVVRALRVANALAAAGLDVHMAMGAAPVPGIDPGIVTAHYLPPLQSAGGSYTALTAAEGKAADEAYKQARRDRLLALYREVSPEILIIEAFPFGRRAMRFELLPLLETARGARPGPLIVSSIRDILHENRKTHLNEETAALVEEAFDMVLVHGDPAFFRLEDSFPLAARIAGKLRYTGIVAPEPPGAFAGPRHDVIVSAGGGAVGRHVLETALAALPATGLKAARWCLVTGPNYGEAEAAGLKARAPDNVAVTPFIGDFCAALAQARLSVSQCGYNTAADLLVAGCPAVFIPSAHEGETEQTRRAEKLAARGMGVVVREAELSSDGLAQAIENARLGPPPDKDSLPRLDGARRSAEAVLQTWRERAAGHG